MSRRVRVLLAPEARSVEGYFAPNFLRGDLISVTPDSITLKPHNDASPVSIANDGIRQLDISRGVSRTRSALKTGLQGALAWYILSAHEYEEDALLWAGGGFALGAVIGAIWPQERWKRVFRQR